MKYFLDTADLEEIKKWSSIIEGVTTNPTKIKTEELKDFVNKAFDISTNIKYVFVQAGTEKDIDVIANNIVRHCKFYDRTIVIKIPLVKQGYDLIPYAKQVEGVELCGTMTYDAVQLDRALESNFQWCIVLNHKNEDKEFCKYAINFFGNPKLIGASFRTKEEVLNLYSLGYNYITVRPETMELVMYNKQASEDWSSLYE